MAEIPVVLKILIERMGEEGIAATERQLQGLANQVQRITTQMTMFAGAAAAALGGMTAAAVHAASNFEQAHTKLEAVLHSSEAATRVFDAAVETAKKTPFEVSSIVQGSVLLTAFGQNAQATIPMVGQLAAGMGKDFQETALALGKALAGSQAGFKSLRNEYGITTMELHRFGAETNSMGGLVLNSEGALNKARAALEKIIGLRFPNALELQMHTMQGIMSNLHDSVTRLAASFGQALLPTLEMLAKGLTSVVSAFERMPDGMKELIAGGMVAGTVMATFGTGLLVVVTVATRLTQTVYGLAAAYGALNMAQGGLVAGAIGPLPAALGGAGMAAGKAGVGIASVGAAFSGALVSMTPFIAALTELAPVIAISAAVVALGMYLNHLGNAAKESGKAIEEQAKALAEATANLKYYADAIDKVTGKNNNLMAST